MTPSQTATARGGPSTFRRGFSIAGFALAVCGLVPRLSGAQAEAPGAGAQGHCTLKAGYPNASCVQAAPNFAVGAAPQPKAARTPAISPVLRAIAPAAVFPERIHHAIQFLANEQDRWTASTSVFEDIDSFAAFYPTNWAGDHGGLTFDARFTQSKVAGLTAIRITYRPTGLSADNWASVSWVYPDIPGHNWGDAPGRDLSGATKLTGWIAGRGAVDLKIGGINTPPHHDPTKPNQDPYVRSIQMALTDRWTRFSIPIPPTARRDSVIGGFTLGFPDGAATVYLDELAYDKAEPDALRLIRSYTPTAAASDDRIRNVAYLYDNAVALIAFLSLGADDSLRRARHLADSIYWVQKNDRAYADGRWRNGYAVGPIKDPATGKARLPGIWNIQLQLFDEDRYSVSSDTGNVSWACIALATAHEVLEKGKQDSPYLRAAIAAAEWIERHCRIDDKYGGYCGGYEGREPTRDDPEGPPKLTWRSVEHNLDYYCVATKLSRLTDRREIWEERARHARKFVLSMWQGEHFWAGTTAEGPVINKGPAPADAQTWAVLAMGHDAEFRRAIGWDNPEEIPNCLKWVEKACRVNDGAIVGYRFSSEGQNCWPEGACHLACVYRCIGKPAEARRILTELVTAVPLAPLPAPPVQPLGGPDLPGGLVAAFPRDAFTGYWKDFGGEKAEPWNFKARKHLGATAWFLMAASGLDATGHPVNPYFITGTPNEPKSIFSPADHRRPPSYRR
jgi:hypothetical protein